MKNYHFNDGLETDLFVWEILPLVMLTNFYKERDDSPFLPEPSGAVYGEFQTESANDHPYLNRDLIRIFKSTMLSTLLITSEPFHGDIPIGIITFILSAFMAVNFELRMRFYSVFDGNVPAITQCLFNCIRLGSISGSSFLVSLDYKVSSYNNLHGKNFAKTLFDPEFLLSKEGFGILLLWFNHLKQHSESDNSPYFEFVKLDKVPVLSDDPVILCNLSARDEKVFWKKNSHFNALSGQKREGYLLLSIGLDSGLKPLQAKADYLDGSYNYAPFDSSEVSNKLVNFIISGCKELLNPETDKQLVKSENANI